MNNKIQNTQLLTIIGCLQLNLNLYEILGYFVKTDIIEIIISIFVLTTQVS